MVNYANEHNGATQKGYKGKIYQNYNGKLPKNVTYKEYDINPNVKGQDRGGERIVIGDDGRVWFTNNHYKTFTEIKNIWKGLK